MSPIPIDQTPDDVKQILQPQLEPEPTTEELLAETFSELELLESEIRTISQRLENLRSDRRSRENIVEHLYKNLNTEEPFHWEKWTVRWSKGRESVRVDDAEAERLVGNLEAHWQKALMATRITITDKKLFAQLFRDGKFSDEANNLIEQFKIVTVSPAVDKVKIERKG